MPKLTPHGDGAHSHGHAKLLQPLLFQLFGLEEELEAALALFVREVESVGPLQKNNTASGGGEAASWRINKPRARVSWRREDTGRQMETKRCKMKEGCLGESQQRVEGWKAGGTDRQTENRERDEGCEVAAPRNCWTADSTPTSTSSRALIIDISQAEG